MAKHNKNSNIKFALGFVSVLGISNVAQAQVPTPPPGERCEYLDRAAACSKVCGLCGFVLFDDCVKRSKCIPDDPHSKGIKKTFTPKSDPHAGQHFCKHNAPGNQWVPKDVPCDCPTGQHNIDGKCVDNCDSGERWNSTNQVCEHFCEHNPTDKWVPDTTPCDCPPHQKLVDGKCTDRCDSKTERWNPAAQTCDHICTLPEISIEGECYKVCPDVPLNKKGHLVKWDQDCEPYMTEHTGGTGHDSEDDNQNQVCEAELEKARQALKDCESKRGEDQQSCKEQLEHAKGTTEAEKGKHICNPLFGINPKTEETKPPENDGSGCNCNPADVDWWQWLLLGLGIGGIIFWRRKHIRNYWITRRYPTKVEPKPTEPPTI